MCIGKPLKISVEFSLVEPQGGIHFVLPENPFKDLETEENIGKKGASLAERSAHLFSCGYENTSR